MLNENQKMWTRATARQFKRQSGMANASSYFELSFLGEIPPDKATKEFHDEGKELFLKELGEKSSE